jgi:chaperonin GroES
MSQKQELLKIARKIREKGYFKPVGDSLIVYRMKLEATAGGIVLPDSSKIQRGVAATGIVISVGPGKQSDLTGNLITMHCKEDDYILFASNSGLELGEVTRKDLGGDSFEELRLLRNSDVIAIMES